MNKGNIKKLQWWAGGGFDANAVTFFTAANITDSTQKTAINTMVVSLKAAGLWTKAKAIYPYVGGNASSHAVNLKSPGTYDITWAGSLTHNSSGVTFDGATGYGSTGLNALSVFGTSYIGMHTDCSAQSNSGMWMAAGTNNFDWTANNNVNNGNAAGVNITGFLKGMSSVVRVDATSTISSSNGDTAGRSYTNTFSANANAVFLLGRYSGGAYCNGTLRFQAITDNLTAAECLTLNNIVFTYNQTLGRASQRIAVFTGDSITYGTGASVHANCWAALFCTNKNLFEVNNAVPSTPLESAVTVITGNLYDDRTIKIPQKNAQRKYLFIAHAVNDAGYNTGNYTTALFQSQYQTILNYAFSLGWAASDIYLVAGFYQNGWSNPWGSVAVTTCDDARYQTFVNMVSTVATANGLRFIDIRGLYGAVDTVDNIHPNDTGHSKIAVYVEGIVP